MKITRKFTTSGSDPFSSVKWVTRSSKITNPDGTVVFQMDDAEVPESWSQLATDIMVSKYFRKAGVPQDGGPNGIASHDWTGSSSASGGTGIPPVSGPVAGKKNTGGTPVPPSQAGTQQAMGPEKSAKQVIHRLAGCWRYWGEKHNYFDTPGDAQAFYDELVFMLVHQMAAPNSPQWFNTGLNWAYGITGPAQGHFVPDPYTGKVDLAKDAYTHPQPHACFIQSVSDDLVNEGGIMDLWVREARLFKYGSGTGTNFSSLRGEGEKLSGGGRSSGLMSWLKIGDRAAAAIKSGGTTRRAAKMVCLDMDHPDIAEFINWKVREEIKVQAMVEGFKVIAGKKASASDSMTVGETANKLGLKLDYDFNGEAYLTVSGQNSNNSIRIPDEFFDAIDTNGEWRTINRTTGKTAKTFKASELWDMLGYAAWRCADPGVQFDTTINAWHTCPSAGRINASNPCSEYMFLDNTACNLASLNVLKFYNPESRAFDVEAYEHAVDLWTIVLEISVLMASFPSKEVAELSFRYRTLGLGYANLGAMLMQAGIAYDSEEARAVCACLTAIMTGRSYRQSAVLASQLGAFAGYSADKENMLRVIRNHRLAAHGVPRDSDSYEALSIAPVPINHDVINAGLVNIANADDLLDHSVRAWDEALLAGEKYGYRNAQVTVIAPTGTIGLLMDCDTTGIEPDFALVKFKKLAGGGYFKIANASVKPALEAMGYSPAQIRDILTYLLGALSLDVAMVDSEGRPAAGTFSAWLKDKGLNDADIAKVNAALPGVFEVGFAFNAWSLGDEAMARLGLDADKAKSDFSFNVLRELGLSKTQISALNDAICGTQTVEGAPHLSADHLPVFDCANKCGKYGKRFIAPEGHIRMMGAAQPFITGAISKTINLPNESSVQDIMSCYRLSWELGLKSNALYRDGCKLSQPLSSTSDSESKDDAKEEASASGKSSAKVGTSAVSPAILEPKTLSDASVDATTMPAAPAAPSLFPMSGAQNDRGLNDRETAAVTHVFARSDADREQIVRVVERPMRRRLPDTRASITHKFNIAGHEGYLTVGLYEDGMPGELFITMAKEGSTIGGLMDSLGTAVSVALQYGVPVESLVNKFTHQRFEPAGMTANRDIPFAKSLVDYIFRWMGMEFIPGYREANAPKREEAAISPEDARRHEIDRLSGHSRSGERGGERWLLDAEASDADEFMDESGAVLGADTDVLEEPAAWNNNSVGPRSGSHDRAQVDRAQFGDQGKTHAASARPSVESRVNGGGMGGAGGAGVARVKTMPSDSSASGAVVVQGKTGGGGHARASGSGASAEGKAMHAGAASMSALSIAMKNNQEDAPACDSCGAITVRSGTCYKCLNCGASMGCS